MWCPRLLLQIITLLYTYKTRMCGWNFVHTLLSVSRRVYVNAAKLPLHWLLIHKSWQQLSPVILCPSCYRFLKYFYCRLWFWSIILGIVLDDLFAVIMHTCTAGWWQLTAIRKFPDPWHWINNCFELWVEQVFQFYEKYWENIKTRKLRQLCAVPLRISTQGS